MKKKALTALAIIICYAAALLSHLAYSVNFAVFLITPVYIAVIVLNYRLTTTFKGLALININVVASAVISVFIANSRYDFYNTVGGSIAGGDLEALNTLQTACIVSAVIAIVAAIVTLVLRRAVCRKKI